MSMQHVCRGGLGMQAGFVGGKKAKSLGYDTTLMPSATYRCVQKQIEKDFLHFDTLNLDPPRLCCLIQYRLCMGVKLNFSYFLKTRTFSMNDSKSRNRIGKERIQ